MSTARPRRKPDWQQLFDALPLASDRDLVRLRVAIDRILLDPERIAAIRRELTVGQTVSYLSERQHGINSGRIVELMADRVLIQTRDEQPRWLHYASIQIGTPHDGDVESSLATRRPYAAGDMVSYEDRDLVHRFGVVIRVNRKTATLENEGVRVRVPHVALRPVVDI